MLTKIAFTWMCITDKFIFPKSKIKGNPQWELLGELFEAVPGVPKPAAEVLCKGCPDLQSQTSDFGINIGVWPGVHLLWLPWLYAPYLNLAPYMQDYWKPWYLINYRYTIILNHSRKWAADLYFSAAKRIWKYDLWNNLPRDTTKFLGTM